MPYIEKNSREFWDEKMKPLVEIIDKDTGAGKINYIITKLLMRWINNNTRYDSICKVVGTCQCVMMEFYRKVAGPYEDQKCKINGDVYTKDECKIEVSGFKNSLVNSNKGKK